MAYMRHMKSMEYGDDDKIDHAIAFPAVKPDFPPNLRISLTEKEFEKLELDPSEAEKDGIVHGHFMGRVTEVAHRDGQGGKSCCVEIQIEDLEIESEDEENEEHEEEE